MSTDTSEVLARVGNLLFHYEEKGRDLESRLKGLRDRADGLSADLSDLNEVNSYFQEYIRFKMERTRNFIQEVVNSGLTYIFGEDICVEITSSIKNNRVTYGVLINDRRNGISGGEESHGGGVLAVVSFLFRFVFNYLQKNLNFMLLDESLTFVSFHYQARLSKFISDLCKRFDYDILLISHQEELNKSADVIYEFSKVGGETRIERIQ